MVQTEVHSYVGQESYTQHFVVSATDSDNEVRFQVTQDEALADPWIRLSIEHKTKQAMQVFRRIQHEVM